MAWPEAIADAELKREIYNRSSSQFEVGRVESRFGIRIDAWNRMSKEMATDSLTKRVKTAIRFVFGNVPIFASAFLFTVSTINGSLPTLVLGLAVIGLGQTILGSVEVTDWRGFSTDYDVQRARLPLKAGWFTLALGSSFLCTAVFIFAAAYAWDRLPLTNVTIDGRSQLLKLATTTESNC